MHRNTAVEVFLDNPNEGYCCSGYRPLTSHSFADLAENCFADVLEVARVGPSETTEGFVEFDRRSRLSSQ